MKTAEEILKDHIVSPEGGWEPTDHDAVIEAMKEYARQFIDMAADEVGDLDGRSRSYKESILKIKERVV